MFDRDSSSAVSSLKGLFVLEAIGYPKYFKVAWSTGSLRKNRKDTAAGALTPDPFPQLANRTGAPNGSLLTYITIADAMVNNTSPLYLF